VPTQEIRALGGIDGAFPEPASEDLDLGYRLQNERGVPLILTPTARALHDHPHGFASWRDHWSLWGHAFWRLVCKRRDPLFVPGGASNLDPANAAAAQALLASPSPLAAEIVGWLEPSEDPPPRGPRSSRHCRGGYACRTRQTT
jgi:hypothetical protein